MAIFLDPKHYDLTSAAAISMRDQCLGAARRYLVNKLDRGFYQCDTFMMALCFHFWGYTEFAQAGLGMMKDDFYVQRNQEKAYDEDPLKPYWEDALKYPTVAQNQYLNVQDFFDDMAFGCYYFKDYIEPSLREEILTFALRVMENIKDPKNAKFNGESAEWQGWSIGNPGNNYRHAFNDFEIRCALAFDNQSMLDEVLKQMDALEVYCGGIADGGSREGTYYMTSWGFQFESFRLLIDSIPSLRARYPNIIRFASGMIYFIAHSIWPSMSQIVALGDNTGAGFASHQLNESDLWILYQAYPLADPEAQSLCAWLLKNTNTNAPRYCGTSSLP
jgi:hypothetical protein